MQYREPKSGKYVLVEPAEDGSFRMAYSPTAIYDENNLMMKEGLSAEQVKKTLAGLSDGSLEIGENGIGAVNGNQKNTENTNATSKPKRMYDIVVLEDGKTYVKASRNIITGNTLAEKRSQITNFFNSLLGRNTSLDLTTIDGEMLTITKDETANKARDNYREENGKRVALTDDEFIVKLHAEAHIDELAETSTKNTKPLVADAKGHNFAKDGFEYKSVYFQDFNGKYYKITLSIGHNGTRATVYNVGRIKEGVLPSAKVIAVRGSIGPWNTPSDSSISQNPEKSTEKVKKDNKKSLAGDEGLKVNAAQNAQEGSQASERAESEQEGVSEAQEAAEAEIKSEKPEGMSERESKRGYSDAEANEARAMVKDFDTMSREKRLSIIEMMRSAKATGASKSFMKRAAAMIGYWRKGLWIIADDKTSEKGFYQSFEDGTRLIVVNPKKKADKGRIAIDTAFVHELAHDIWDRATAKMRDALYRLATEGATAAEVDDIREEYKKGYEARGLKLDEETLREEVFTGLIAKTLGNERFLERFELTPGRMTAFKRSIKAVTRMAKCFVGKDRYLYYRCEKMARSLIRVMGEQAALEAVGSADTGKKYRFDNYSSYDGQITLEDIADIRQLEQRSINKLTDDEIIIAKKWASKFYKELDIKSPFFRRWFGEWRAFDQGEVRIVSVPTINISEAILQKGDYQIEDTGWIVYAGKNLNDDTRHHSGGNRVNVKALNSIGSILSNSILLDTIVSKPDTKKKSDKTAFLHKLYTLIKYDGQYYIAKTTIEEYYNETIKNAARRAYNLKAIKIEPVGGQLGLKSSSSIPGTSSIVSIADLYELVKTYDKEFSPAPEVSKSVLNDDGTPKILYHQTAEEFTEFDPRRKGAGTNDDETPFGIFMKPTDEDIGLRGKKQMPLYARIVNPLMVHDRFELSKKLKAMSSEYSELIGKREALTQEYQKKIDEAGKAWAQYAKEYREAHPGATRSELNEDAEFNRLFDAEDALVDEWTSKANDLAIQCKVVITKTLKANNYDGVFIKNDAGSFGRAVETYIALEATQVKSATDNIGTFDGNNPNIRYSFDPDTFIQQAMENGGMVEKPKSQTDTKKATEEKLKAKVEDLKKENERLEREAKASERKAKPAEDPTVFSGFVMLLDVNAKKLLCKDSYYEGNYGNADTDSCHFKETRRKLHILCHRGVIGEARDNKNDNSYHNCQSNKGIGDKYVGKNERNYCEKIRNSCV